MGLGAEYARQIAARGLNLVLVAWPADGLEELAQDLERRYGIETRRIVLDLADRAGVRSLRRLMEKQIGVSWSKQRASVPR